MSTRTWIIVLVVAALLIAAYFYFTGSSKKSESNNLATCLTNKGAKFYGASWCGYCNDQKAMFDNPKKLPYIECSDANRGLKQECANAGVSSFPTWVFANGEKRLGKLSFEELKQLSGC